MTCRRPIYTSAIFLPTSPSNLWVFSLPSADLSDRFVPPRVSHLRASESNDLSFLGCQVKIMYPRLDDPRSNADASELGVRRVGIRAGLSGFVSFMKRPDAEQAIKDFDGLDWGGSILKVGWSKAVPIPRTAIYGQSAQSRLASPFDKD